MRGSFSGKRGGGRGALWGGAGGVQPVAGADRGGLEGDARRVFLNDFWRGEFLQGEFAPRGALAGAHLAAGGHKGRLAAGAAVARAAIARLGRSARTISL